jgi:SPP1 family predicted phage head-tail adaptor
MQAGTLRARVAVQEPLEARDDIGGVQQVWLTVAEVWAGIEPLRAKELFEAQSIEARLSHRITLRAYRGLQTRWRLMEIATGRVFQIYSTRDLHERHRTTEVLAMELIA